MYKYFWVSLTEDIALYGKQRKISEPQLQSLKASKMRALFSMKTLVEICLCLPTSKCLASTCFIYDEKVKLFYDNALIPFNEYKTSKVRDIADG